MVAAAAVQEAGLPDAQILAPKPHKIAAGTQTELTHRPMKQARGTASEAVLRWEQQRVTTDYTTWKVGR